MKLWRSRLGTPLPVRLKNLNTSKSGPECCNNALWSGPMLRRPKELAAFSGHLPGFDCKRRPMRPSATWNFLKWPMAWKRLESTARAWFYHRRYVTDSIVWNKVQLLCDMCVSCLLLPAATTTAEQRVFSNGYDCGDQRRGRHGRASTLQE